MKGLGYFPGLQAGFTAVSAAECARQRSLLSFFFSLFPFFAAPHGAEGAGIFLAPWLVMVKALL